MMINVRRKRRRYLSMITASVLEKTAINVGPAFGIFYAYFHYLTGSELSAVDNM